MRGGVLPPKSCVGLNLNRNTSGLPRAYKYMYITRKHRAKTLFLTALTSIKIMCKKEITCLMHINLGEKVTPRINLNDDFVYGGLTK